MVLWCPRDPRRGIEYHVPNPFERPLYLSHLWGISTCRMIFTLQSINQPSHPRLVPLDLILDLIHPIGLLAYAVAACYLGAVERLGEQF